MEVHNKISTIVNRPLPISDRHLLGLAVAFLPFLPILVSAVGAAVRAVVSRIV